MEQIIVDTKCPKSVERADTRSHKLLLSIVVCTATLMLSPAMRGQATGNFSGNVTDKAGSAIPGAAIIATSQGTGQQRNTKADGSGHYLLPLLPVGTYTVHVDASGFQSAESKDLVLQVDAARELDFSLVPATVVTTVAVSGEAVAVESANPSLGQVITSQEVSQLPLNGRDFVQLATLTSGATAETNPGSFFTSAASSEVAARGPFSLSVGGSRPNSTDFLLDGVDNNELSAGGIGVYSSIDDIQEFKVLTYTYSAEYGTRAGPTVLVTTKGGTNNIHGSLYEFVRNTDLDAKSYFATSIEKFNLNQFGGSLGGPIRKNKTFLFVDGEQKYQLHEIPFTGLVPSLAQRTGDFSSDPFGNPVSGLGIVNPNTVGAPTNPNVYPNIYFQRDAAGNALPAKADGSQAAGTACNKIPQNLINPIGQTFINLYPTPNANNASAGINYTSQPIRQLDQTKFDVRLDHTISNLDSLFARFSYDQAFSFVPGGSPGFAEADAFGSNQRIRNHARNVAIGETHVFSANMVNQASFGYNRIFDYITSQGTGSCISQTIGIPNANLGCTPGSTVCHNFYSCGLVSTEFQGGYWSLGDRGFSPFQGGTNVFSFRDSLDYIHNKHDFKFGIDLRGNQLNVGTEAFQDGFWIVGVAGNFTGNSALNIAGNSEADLLQGITGLAIHDQTFLGPVTGRRWKSYRPFAEDNWRPKPSLTLNIGLAWNLTTPITDIAGRQADYLPLTGQLLIANQNGVGASAGIDMDWTGLEPRVGATWKVFGSDKTVLRLGYGIYHDTAWSQGAQGLWQNPPNTGESDAFGAQGCAFVTSYCATTLAQTPTATNLSSGFQAIPTPPTAATFTGNFSYEPTNLKHGMVQQYNVNVERELAGNLVLTAGYAGAQGTHILVTGNNLTTNSPTACGTVQNYTLGCNFNGSPYSSPYVAPNFNDIFLFGDVGRTSYNSLQIKAETKTSNHGLYALFAYTYSRTYDNGLTDGLGSVLSAPYFPLPNWPNLDHALSQINLDNSFIGSVIYDLPVGRGKLIGSNWNSLTNTLLGNFQLTLIQRISSGFPATLIDSINNAGNTFSNGGNDNNFNRPDQIAGCNTGNADHGKRQWINTACFVAPPNGELGNASRAPATGPDFVNTDFSVIKQFGLPREIGLNFRAEFFNLFNHSQFGSPVNDISSPGFGFVQSTVNNPREIQLALKLTF